MEPYKWTPPSHADWPFGPWDDEPDSWTGTLAGYVLVIRRMPLGHLCGYVGVPLDHPIATGLLNPEDLSVHGGVTFDQANAGLHWIGFDCAHAGDVSPERTAQIPGATYRTLEYVKQELFSLAEQLAQPITIPPPLTISGEDTLRLRILIAKTYDSDLQGFFAGLVEKSEGPV